MSKGREQHQRQRKWPRLSKHRYVRQAWPASVPDVRPSGLFQRRADGRGTGRLLMYSRKILCINFTPPDRTVIIVITTCFACMGITDIMADELRPTAPALPTTLGRPPQQ